MNNQQFFKQIEDLNKSSTVPNVIKSQEFIDEMINFMFPIRNKEKCDISKNQKWQQLEFDLNEIIYPLKNKEIDVDKVVTKFFSSIPNVYYKLHTDIDAIIKFDPAAYSIQEIVLAYPGFYAIAVYRLSNILYNLKIPIIPRIMSEYAHSQTGIDINSGASIGDSFFIDHGTGIVIGETTEIGQNVKIYQGVTLGALTVKKTEAFKKRHPTIEDNVVIYSNSTILGGNTIVGHNSVIGGNVWLTQSVEPFSVVYHTNEINIRQNLESNELVNFVI